VSPLRPGISGEDRTATPATTAITKSAGMMGRPTREDRLLRSARCLAERLSDRRE
jgi:hypothetical protein